MTDTRRFPIIRGQSRLGRAICDTWPRTVPWSFVERFRAQAELNHDQTLERLAERGGLAPDELWCAANSKALFPMPDEKACGDWLVAEMKKLGES